MNINSNRPCWDEIWMKFAKIISERSYDPRMKVGSVIVASDNSTVLSLGYNGNYPSGPNVPDSVEPGRSGFIHAEINSLIKCPFHYHTEKIMYVTLSPCIQCAKAIIAGGIKTVVYCDEYRDISGIKLLNKAKVQTRQYLLE